MTEKPMSYEHFAWLVKRHLLTDEIFHKFVKDNNLEDMTQDQLIDHVTTRLKYSGTKIQKPKGANK